MFIFTLFCNTEISLLFQLADLPESELAPIEGYPAEISQDDGELVPLPDIIPRKRKAPTVAIGTKEVPVVKM